MGGLTREVDHTDNATIHSSFPLFAQSRKLSDLIARTEIKHSSKKAKLCDQIKPSGSSVVDTRDPFILSRTESIRRCIQRAKSPRNRVLHSASSQLDFTLSIMIWRPNFSLCNPLPWRWVLTAGQYGIWGWTFCFVWAVRKRFHARHGFWRRRESSLDTYPQVYEPEAVGKESYQTQTSHPLRLKGRGQAADRFMQAFSKSIIRTCPRATERTDRRP